MVDFSKIGWIFDGGGFLASYGAGMAQACWELGIRPQYIQVVSGGIFNGGEIAAAQNTDEIKNKWLQVEQQGAKKIFGKGRMVFNIASRANSLFSDEGVLSLIKNFIDLEKIRESPIEFEVATVNESKHDEAAFFSNKHLTKDDVENFAKALYASTALMGFLPPIEIRGQIFSDGLCFDVRRAFRKGCKTVFIFSNSLASQEYTSPEQQSFYWRIRHCLRLAVRGKIFSEIEALLREKRSLYIHHHPYLPPRLAQLQKATSRRKRELCIVYLNPIEDISSLEIVTFKKGDIARAIEHGHEIARAVVKRLL